MSAMELEKFKIEMQFKREEAAREREREKEEVERQKNEKEREFQLEMKRLELQTANLQAQHSAPPQSHAQFTFDVAKNVRLLPKFDEGDVESFFVTFEGCAEKLKWPEECWTVMLRSVFTGEAQKVCSQLPIAEPYERLK